MTFAIDECNVFSILGGGVIMDLVTEFYNRVYEDPDEWFRSIFPPDKAASIQNLGEFMIQRLHGPPLYSKRKGHPALRMRHAGFRITQQAAHRWLKHMTDAMDSTPSIAQNPTVSASLTEFFNHTANFLVNTEEVEETSTTSAGPSVGTEEVKETSTTSAGPSVAVDSSQMSTELDILISHVKEALRSSTALTPMHLRVTGHVEHDGTHISIDVVSAAFEGIAALERHRLVHSAIAVLQPRIHALSIRATTPTRHAANGAD